MGFKPTTSRFRGKCSTFVLQLPSSKSTFNQNRFAKSTLKPDSKKLIWANNKIMSPDLLGCLKRRVNSQDTRRCLTLGLVGHLLKRFYVWSRWEEGGTVAEWSKSLRFYISGILCSSGDSDRAHAPILYWNSILAFPLAKVISSMIQRCTIVTSTLNYTQIKIIRYITLSLSLLLWKLNIRHELKILNAVF